MPVVIRELVVRAVVSPTGDPAAGQLAIDEQALKRLKKELTKEVAEQVLHQINRKTER